MWIMYKTVDAYGTSLEKKKKKEYLWYEINTKLMA